MTQAELVAQLVKETGITKSKAEEVLKSLGGIVKSVLKKGDSVRLPGVGTFKVVERAARSGRNPRTGKTIQIAARKAVKFEATKPLAEEIK